MSVLESLMRFTAYAQNGVYLVFALPSLFQFCSYTVATSTVSVMPDENTEA